VMLKISLFVEHVLNASIRLMITDFQDGDDIWFVK
jgi:hypothetical protein